MAKSEMVVLVQVEINLADVLSDEIIDKMTSRFLQWKLPRSMSPDGGLSIDRSYFSDHGPVGTNLFSHSEAKAMIKHMIEGIA